MIYAKPSTALVVVFRAYLASDHVTPATGKTIAITISKNGGAFGNPNAGATNATEMSSGFYKVTLDTTDTGTAGPLAVRGAVATVDDVGAIFYVGQAPADLTHVAGTAVTAAAGIPEVKVASIAANAITASAVADGAIDAGAIASDAITAAKIADGAIDAATFAAGAITATVIADGAIDAATFAAGAIDASAIAANAIGASELAADAIAEIADAVWDEDATAHQTGGTFGQAIGDPGADTTTIYQSVVTDAAGTNVAADIIAMKADTAAILLDTGTDGVVVAAGSKTGYSLTATTGLGNQTADITGNLSGSVGSVTGAVGSVTGAVGSVTGAVGSVTGAVGSVTGNVGGNVTGSVGSLATQAKADVNAEVVDCLNVDTYAEPVGAPAATSTLRAKLGWVFKLLRNKRTQTSTTETLYADDATTADATSTKSDDGTTATRGEWTA